MDPPRRERSSQLRTGAGQEEALIALLPRGTVVDLQTSSPSVAQREIWYRVRVVCTEDGSSEGKEGFLHAVALPGLLPIGRLRGPTDFRLRGGPDADRHATLAKGTRVAILTVGEAGGRAVRVLDGAEANQSGWIEDAKAIEP